MNDLRPYHATYHKMFNKIIFINLDQPENYSFAKTNLKESCNQFKLVIKIKIQILKLVDYFQKDVSWKS